MKVNMKTQKKAPRKGLTQKGGKLAPKKPETIGYVSYDVKNIPKSETWVWTGSSGKKYKAKPVSKKQLATYAKIQAENDRRDTAVGTIHKILKGFRICDVTMILDNVKQRVYTNSIVK